MIAYERRGKCSLWIGYLPISCVKGIENAAGFRSIFNMGQLDRVRQTEEAFLEFLTTSHLIAERGRESAPVQSSPVKDRLFAVESDQTQAIRT